VQVDVGADGTTEGEEEEGEEEDREPVANEEHRWSFKGIIDVGLFPVSKARVTKVGGHDL
jgi:hypothetical protein